jgi:FKBP-type peptidyl-prolyl cis-trans isomerase 2
MERTAQSGDMVKIHIRGRLEDGQLFFDSHKDKAVEFEIGQSKVLKGIQQAVIGMKPDETKNALIPPEKGFGQHKEDLIREIERSNLSEDTDYTVGQNIPVQDGSGKTMSARVVDITDAGIKVDLNHPLAGKSFNCELTLLEIT